MYEFEFRDRRIYLLNNYVYEFLRLIKPLKIYISYLYFHLRELLQAQVSAFQSERTDSSPIQK